MTVLLSLQILVPINANQFIIDNAKLLTDFKAIKGGVKGIGRDLVSILGEGTLLLPLHSDDGSTDCITIAKTVYVPQSPFNIAPPQILITALQSNGYNVEWFKHSDSK